MGCVLEWIIAKVLSYNFAWQIKGNIGFKLKGGDKGKLWDKMEG